MAALPPSVPPLNFGSRIFTTKLQYQNEGDSLYVSAIGPTLFLVPVRDVPTDVTDSSQKECSIRKRQIRVFSNGIGINIKGIVKFPDSDHAVVFSSRYLAVLHSDELKEFHKKDGGITDDAIVLCADRVIAMSNNLKIIDLRCANHGKLLIVCDENIVVAELKHAGEEFSLDIGKKDQMLHHISAGKIGVYDVPIPVTGTISACCFFGSITSIDKPTWTLVLAGKSGMMSIVNPKRNGFSVVGIFNETAEPFINRRPANMLTPCVTKQYQMFGHIANTHMAVLAVDAEAKEVMGSQFTYRNDFILGHPDGLAVVGRGSIYFHDMEVIHKLRRMDVLSTGSVAYLAADIRRSRLLVAGVDSTWMCTLPIEKWWHADLTKGPVEGRNPVQPVQFVCAVEDMIYKITAKSEVYVYRFKNGELDSEAYGDHLLVDGIVVNDVRPSPTSSKAHRLIMNTTKGLIAYDMNEMCPLEGVNEALMNTVWATPVGKDTLILLREGGMLLTDDEKRVSMICDAVVSTRDCKDLNRNLIVRRLSRGKNCGLVFAYKNQLKHLVYEIPPEDVKITKTVNLLREQPIYQMPLRVCQGDIAKGVSKADSVHIADLLLEVGGALSILLRNGTIIQYTLDMNLKRSCFDFTFKSSRRVDGIGMNLLRTPRGLAIFGLVNNYKPNSECRTCEDDMEEIDRIIAQEIDGKANALPAIIDPVSGQVLSRMNMWNTDYNKSAFITDFKNGQMNSIVVHPDNNSEPGIYQYGRHLQYPINLTRDIRPPGMFKGMASTKIDERFHMVVMCFSNVHVFVLDTVTGSCEERAVFGWESDLSAPTLSEVNNDHAFLMVHSGHIFTLIDLRPHKKKGSYDIELLPVLRRVPGKNVVKKDYINWTFESFRTGAESQSSLTRFLYPGLQQADRCDSMVQLKYTAKGDSGNVYFRVTPFSEPNKDRADVEFVELITLKKAVSLRETLLIRSTAEIFVAEADKAELVFRHGRNNLLREPIELPVRSLSPLCYVAVREDKSYLFGMPELDLSTVTQKMVLSAVVDGHYSMWVYTIGVNEDGTLEREYQPCVVPFPKTNLPVKLFLRASCNRSKLIVFVYRLIKRSNILEAARLEYSIKSKKSEWTTRILPDIFLEMDGVEDLEKLDIRFVNSEFLFINDGPRLIRVCECAKKSLTDEGESEKATPWKKRTSSIKKMRIPHLTMTF